MLGPEKAIVPPTSNHFRGNLAGNIVFKLNAALSLNQTVEKKPGF
jgi:hypothetical protein